MKTEKLYNVLAGLMMGIIPLMFIGAFSIIIQVEIEMNTLHIGMIIITYLFSSFFAILALMERHSEEDAIMEKQE